jgi:hypothetical protein
MTGSIASSSRLRPSLTRPVLINARLQIVVAKATKSIWRRYEAPWAVRDKSCAAASYSAVPINE